MAKTITVGQLGRDGLTVKPVDNTTWGDLGSSPFGSWENWSTWNPSPRNIEVSELQDTGSLAYRVPTVIVETQGDLTITVDISSTGLFAGEETTLSFTDSSAKSYPQGRYYRWNFTVAPNADDPIPYLQYSIDLNEAEYDQYIKDVNIPVTSVDGSGNTEISNIFGAVTYVQGTTHQGDDYVTDGYYLTRAEQQALDGRLLETVYTSVRTAKEFTEYGNVTWSTTTGKYAGQSIKFDGTGDYITLDTYEDFGFGTGDFTIESWVYSGSWTGNMSIADFRTVFADSALQIGLINGVAYVFCNGTYVTTAITSLSTSTWHHVAVVRKSGILSIFINGTLEASVNFTTNLGTTKPLKIGVDYSTTRSYFNGYMDNVRVSRIARYREGFDFASLSVGGNGIGTYGFHDDIANVLLLQAGTWSTFTQEIFDRIDDYGIQPITVSTAQAKWDSRSIIYGSNDSRAFLRNNTGFWNSTDTFTLEFWVRITSGSDTGELVNITYSTKPGSLLSMRVRRDGTGARIHYSIDNDGTTAYSPYLALDTWHHVAITRDRGIFYEFFVNGVQESAPTVTDTEGVDAGPITFGYNPHDQDGDVFGAMTEAYLDGINLANTLRYTESTYTIPTDSIEDTDTFFAWNDSTTFVDEGVELYSDDAYVVEQLGGSVVIESKNPLTVKVVDYDGLPWDGTADLHVRGLPKIAKVGNRLVTKFE